MVLQLSISGLADKEVAARLGLSIDTVKTYWKRIRQKSRGRTRPEIVAYFLQKENREQLQANRVEIGRLIEEVQRFRTSEIQLKSSAEQRLRAWSEASFDMVAVFRAMTPEVPDDAEFRFDYANGLMATFLERTKEYLVGRRLRDVFPGAYASDLGRVLSRAISSGELAEEEIFRAYKGIAALRVRVVPTNEGAVLVAKPLTH